MMPPRPRSRESPGRAQRIRAPCDRRQPAESIPCRAMTAHSREVQVRSAPHADVRRTPELYSSTMFGKKAAARTKPEVHPGGLTRDHVVWAYRLLLDRDPESEDVIGPKLAGSRDTSELRRHLMTSAEFQEKNRDYAHTNDRTVVIKELESGVRLFVDLADHVI